MLGTFEPKEYVSLLIGLYDSVFAKRVLMYSENRGNPGNSHMNVFIVPMENYTFLER